MNELGRQASWRAWIGVLAVMACAALPVRSAGQEGVDEPLALAREALEANPGLAALEAQTAALQEVVATAGTWQDPVLRLAYANAPIDSLRLDESPMSALEFGVQQTLPSWGWSSLRRRVADARAKASRHALAEAESRLRREVVTLFHRLTLSRQLRDVTRENVERADELLRSVRARYETGRAAQHELLRLEILSRRLADGLREFERADRELSAALARGLARAPGAEFRTPRQLEPIHPEGDPESWMERALRHRSELKRLERSEEEAVAAAELARTEARPPVTVQLAYRVRSIDVPTDDGTDQVGASVSIPIPLGSAARSRSAFAAQRQLAREARARHAEQIDRIEEALASIHARWTRAYERARTYADALVPRARAALETARADYSVGRTGFVTLYEAEIEVFGLEREALEAAVETHLQAAELDAAIGDRLEGGVR